MASSPISLLSDIRKSLAKLELRETCNYWIIMSSFENAIYVLTPHDVLSTVKTWEFFSIIVFNVSMAFLLCCCSSCTCLSLALISFNSFSTSYVLVKLKNTLIFRNYCQNRIVWVLAWVICGGCIAQMVNPAIDQFRCRSQNPLYLTNMLSIVLCTYSLYLLSVLNDFACYVKTHACA